MSSWGNAFKKRAIEMKYLRAAGVLLSVLEIPAHIISHESSIHLLVSVPAAIADC